MGMVSASIFQSSNWKAAVQCNWSSRGSYRRIADRINQPLEFRLRPSWRRRDNFRNRQQQQCVKPTLASTTFKLTGRSGSPRIGIAGRHSAGIGGCFHRNTQSFEGYGGALAISSVTEPFAVLTPASTIKAIQSGYSVQIHSSSTTSEICNG